MYRGWTKIDYQDKHCITDQTDKGTEDDQGRDGRTNFTWRIKEQATLLNPLFEHDDDDDDDDDDKRFHIHVFKLHYIEILHKTDIALFALNNSTQSKN